MGELGRKQRKDTKPRRELIETYLSQNPDATLKEVGNFLGVTSQRAHIVLRRLGIRTRVQKSRQLARESETEILRYIATGYTNRQIAALLGVSKSIIEGRVSLILAKFKAENRAEAVKLAKQQGLI